MNEHGPRHHYHDHGGLRPQEMTPVYNRQRMSFTERNILLMQKESLEAQGYTPAKLRRIADMMEEGLPARATPQQPGRKRG